MDYMGIAILFISFFGLILIRIPIALVLIISSLITGIYLEIDPAALVQRMVGGLNSYSLLAIPFFLLMGEIMNAGGISQKIVNLANLLVGRVRGGLGMVNVVDSTFFGGISGSALADTASLGSILIPMMKKQGYDARFSTAATISTSIQGILIPPSHNMIIYSTAAGGLSVGALFLGGLVPGLLLGFSFIILVYILARKRNYPYGERVPRSEIPRIIREGFFGLMTIVIIMVGVLTGYFTVTESAAIATVYAFLISLFVYRDLKLKDMWPVLKNTFNTLASVLFLIAASNGFGWLLALLRVPALVADTLLSISPNRIVTVLLILLILIVLGCFMDMAPLIVITTPILLPVWLQIGLDPIHFGVVLMLALGIGLLTPPVGSVLFVGSAIGGITIEETAKEMVPWYLTMVIVLLIITFFPVIVLTIPRVLGLM